MKAPISKLLAVVSIPLIVLIAVLAGIYLNQNKDSAGLPAYGKVFSFQLTDSAGAPFESLRLSGKPWIASFIFSRCQNQTPPMIAKMKNLSKQFPDLRFVSITVDPEYDKPEVLNQFIKQGTGPDNWLFLTGSQTEIENASAALRVPMPSSPGLHSTRFVLIDGEGQIRGFYDSQSRSQMNELESDIPGLSVKN